MKVKIVAIIFFTILICIVIDGLTNKASTNTGGAPAGNTGSPGDGIDCTDCHAGPAAETQTGWITSNIPAGGYTAGSTYQISATVTRPGHSKFGFEISPQNLSGSFLGTLLNSDVTNTQLLGGSKYITHTASGTSGTSGFHTWTFNWKAPVSGSGTVTFYGAFNATNSSNSSSGDSIFLSTLDVPECAITIPVITPNGNTTFCQGGNVMLTSSAATSYLWNTGATTQSITVSTGGNYSVTVMNAGGCAATSAQTIVTVNSIPSPSITPNGNTTFCQGGNVMLTSGAATSYLWSTGSTTQSITVSTNGNYSVTVINANGCSATSSPTTVTVNSNPTTPSISPNGNTTFCQGGSVMLTSSSEATYLWSNAATTQSITVSSGGNYSVTVNNASGCSATSTQTTVTVNSNPSTPVITPGGNTTFCQGGNVTLTSSPEASYLWSTGATTQNISVTTSGAYSVIVGNVNGCTATSTPVAVTVNSGPATPTITPGGNTTFCQGGSVMLTSSAATSYLWSTGATTQNITVTTTGNYSVIVSNAGGCTSTSAPVFVTVNSFPAQPIITPGGNTTFCQGGGVNLTSSPATTYSWSNGATTQSIIATVAGNYTVTITNAGGCSATSAPTTIAVNPNPVNPVITPGGSTAICQGGSITLTSSSATLYFWSTGATTQSINVSSAGNYSVTITNAVGCSKASIPITITVNPLPSTPVITPVGNTTFCEGGSVVLNSSTANSYLWNNGATTQSITDSSAGNFSVTVTNANGCSKTSNPLLVTVHPNPAPSIIGINSACVNEKGVIYSVTDSVTNFQWSITGGTIVSGQGTDSIKVDWGGAGNGVIGITETNGATNCSGSSSLNVSINSTLNPVITASGSTTLCQGDSVTLDASAGYFSYLWNSGDTTQTISVKTPGSYSVDVASANGCTGTSLNPVSVIVNAIPSAPTIEVLGNTIFCNGDSAILTSRKASSYLWSNGPTTQSISVFSPGNYIVTISDSNGCRNSDSITIEVNIVDTSVTLNGFVFNSNASPALYHWLNCDLMDTIPGEISQSFSPDKNGSYAVIVEQNGCRDTSGCYPIIGLGLTEIKSDKISVYPNPAHEKLIIDCSYIKENSLEIILSDIYGRQIKKEYLEEFNSPIVLDWNINELVNGIYILNINSKSNHSSFRIEKN